MSQNQDSVHKVIPTINSNESTKLISGMPNPRAPSNTGARASGRIPVVFRATNDAVGILGNDVELGDDYNEIVQETLDKEITEKT